MKAVRIKVEPFDEILILSYNGVFQINEHGYVRLSGVIPESKRDSYLQKAMDETWVRITVCDEEEDERPLFYGVLKGFSIQPGIDGSRMELLLYTGTWLMDQDKHKRSFQKSGYTYKEVADCCQEGYSQPGMIMTEGKDTAIPGFLMQYGESDWRFLKRVASSLHTVLVPASYIPGEKFFFGLPQKQVKGKLDTKNYMISRSDGSHLDENGQYPLSGLSYIVRSRDIYFLGDTVSFNGQEYCVGKLETSLDGSELWHTYHLIKRSALDIPRSYNREMTGLSLLGRIQAVEGEQVKMAIDVDENRQGRTCWFPFSTVYSSPDGAGWYCMPEIGDAVRLYFPTEDEMDAYVTSAYHEEQGHGIRVDPSHKIWRNKVGKEIRLTPEMILVTNNKGMSVRLSDREGIKISSDASITIEATGDIKISSANASLEMSASNKIGFSQGDTRMELADSIKMSGATIKMQ
ncbi:MAG: hypothetical protein HFG22_14120 [Lachnospiraceae bacterium]|nr:hypothetical protein [Lachnospiraceae bacterium]